MAPGLTFVNILFKYELNTRHLCTILSPRVHFECHACHTIVGVKAIWRFFFHRRKQTSTHLFLKTLFLSFLSIFQREANDIHRHSVITWRVSAPEDKVMSQAWKGNLFYGSGSPRQMLTKSQPSAKRWPSCMPPLLLRATLVNSHTVQSAVRAFIMEQRVKYGHWHVHSWTGVQRYHSTYICLLVAVFMPQSIMVVINGLFNVSEPPGAATERVTV